MTHALNHIPLSQLWTWKAQSLLQAGNTLMFSQLMISELWRVKVEELVPISTLNLPVSLLLVHI